MILGAVVGALLLPGPIMIGPTVGLDVHTLLFAVTAILIGFQGVSFAFCARIYALNEGLLPEDPILERLFRRFTLESGLAVGAVLLAAGIGSAIYAFVVWSRAGFGALNAQTTLRTVIPAAGAICLGGQVIFTSFLLSFLGLRRR